MNQELKSNVQFEFLNLLMEGNHSKCSELVKKVLSEEKKIYYLYDDIIKKTLYQIGEMWEFNKISVATEHLASAIVEGILNEIYCNVSFEKMNNKSVVVACAENEFHQIGIRMVGDIFERNGWNVHFLGTNTSSDDLITFVKSTQPNLIAISLSIFFHLPIFEKMLKNICNEVSRIPILVGGQAFLHGGHEMLTKFNNVSYISDLKSTEYSIQSLKK